MSFSTAHLQPSISPLCDLLDFLLEVMPHGLSLSPGAGLHHGRMHLCKSESLLFISMCCLQSAASRFLSLNPPLIPLEKALALEFNFSFLAGQAKCQRSLRTVARLPGGGGEQSPVHTAGSTGENFLYCRFKKKLP